jgi:hypothetical protein
MEGIAMPLTPEEVEQLRRIHVLSQFGELPEPMQALLDELRARDSGGEILAPTVVIEFIPKQSTREDALENLLNLVDSVDRADGAGYDDELFVEDLDDGSLVQQHPIRQ